MLLTIQDLFNSTDIVGAIINRVNQTKKDTVYWKQFMHFDPTTTRVFKDYIGRTEGVTAGSINSRFGEKPIRERRNMGSGIGEVAYLGDRYQISVDRLSILQDLLDKFNAAGVAQQATAINNIVNFLLDDYRQVTLAAHKRMDIVVGSLLMTGNATVRNKDAAVEKDYATPLLDIGIPLNVVTPADADVTSDGKKMLVMWLMGELDKLAPDYGKYTKMIMSRKTFVNRILGSSEFGDKFKMQLQNNSLYTSTGLITSELASQLFTGLGLPAIEVKDDYVKDQSKKKVQVYADDHITLLPQDQIGRMRHHTPYEKTDPEPGVNYTPTGEGQMLVAGYRDHNGRYLEYTCEWIPQVDDPTEITTIDLSKLSAWK